MIRLSALEPTTATIRSGSSWITHRVAKEPSWYPVDLTAPPIQLLHNTGSILTDDDYGADRGYLEPDDGRYDGSGDVFAWCGAAVLLRREYLEEVGLFDERLFLYYEDFELAWRGNSYGWVYRYVPECVVEHIHAASSGEGSSLQRYYNERNRLLVLTRHASWSRVLRAIVLFVAVTTSYALRDVVSPVLRGRSVERSIVADRIRAFAAYLHLAPPMVCSRWRDR
jgi:GT2 family glycosyltransferase